MLPAPARNVTQAAAIVNQKLRSIPDVRENLVDHGEVFQSREHFAMGFIEEDGKLWKAVLKSTRDGSETYLLILHRSYPKNLAGRRAGTTNRYDDWKGGAGWAAYEPTLARRHESITNMLPAPARNLTQAAAVVNGLSAADAADPQPALVAGLAGGAGSGAEPSDAVLAAAAELHQK